MSKKIILRIRKTQEQKDFWDLAVSTATGVKSYPKWKRIR